MELIDKGKVLKHLGRCIAESTGDTPIVDAVLTVMKEYIETIPTVDAGPVVRCKDCVLQQECKNAQYLGMDGFCSNVYSLVGTMF